MGKTSVGVVGAGRVGAWLVGIGLGVAIVVELLTGKLLLLLLLGLLVLLARREVGLRCVTSIVALLRLLMLLLSLHTGGLTCRGEDGLREG